VFDDTIIGILMYNRKIDNVFDERKCVVDTGV
jgi:hypothetical protein